MGDSGTVTEWNEMYLIFHISHMKNTEVGQVQQVLSLEENVEETLSQCKQKFAKP